MFWKKKNVITMSAADAWLLGVLSPFLASLGMPSDTFLEPDQMDEYLAMLEELEHGTPEMIQADVIYRIFKGERPEIAALQRANPHQIQYDPIVYDLVMGMLFCRAGINAGLLEQTNGYGLMFCYARRLQPLYTSWRDFIVAFSEVYGVQREMIGETAPEIAEAKAAMFAKSSALLQPDGIWQKIPWKLNLPPEGETDLEQLRVTHLMCAIFYRSESTFIPSSYHWCLAIASIYRSWWGEAVDSLEPAEVITQVLDTDWGVENRAGLLEVMRGILLHGHRFDLEPMQRQQGLPEQNLIAWDLVRIMQLATSGVSAGLLTTSEAKDLMLVAAQPLQAAYGDWRDMTIAFKAARNLWQSHAKQTEEDIGSSNDDLDGLLEALHSQSNSPFQKIPWDYPLELVAPESEFANFAAAKKVEWWHEPNINKKF